MKHDWDECPVCGRETDKSQAKCDHCGYCLACSG